MPRRAARGTNERGQSVERVRVERIEEHLEQSREAALERRGHGDEPVRCGDRALGFVEVRGHRTPVRHGLGELTGEFAQLEDRGCDAFAAGGDFGCGGCGEGIGKLAGRGGSGQAGGDDDEVTHGFPPWRVRPGSAGRRGGPGASRGWADRTGRGPGGGPPCGGAARARPQCRGFPLA